MVKGHLLFVKVYLNNKQKCNILNNILKLTDPWMWWLQVSSTLSVCGYTHSSFVFMEEAMVITQTELETSNE